MGFQGTLTVIILPSLLNPLEVTGGGDAKSSSIAMNFLRFLNSLDSGEWTL